MIVPVKHELYGNSVVLHKRDLAESFTNASIFSLFLSCLLFKYKVYPNKMILSALPTSWVHDLY